MRAQRIWFLACIPLIFAIVWLVSIVSPSVGQTGVQAYTYGSVTVSPNSGYYGDAINMSGTGQLPNVTLDAYLSGTDGTQSFYAFLGNPETDAAGNWNLTFLVPATVIDTSSGTAVATMVAGWPVGASVTQDAYNDVAGDIVAVYDSYTYLYVLGPRPTSVPLPNTGFPFMQVVLGAPLMVSGGVGLRIARYRRRSQT